MTLDGLLLAASLREIKIALGSIVERIHMPYPDTLIFTLYRPGGNTSRLLIRCHASGGRIHLTGLRPANPASPPDYCMLLRKHLQGKRLLDAGQHGLDRLVYFIFGTGTGGRDFPATPQERLLFVELLGARVNAVLTTGDRRILGSLFPYRRQEPAAVYSLPEPTGKLDLRAVTGTDLRDRLATISGLRPAWRALLSAIEGPGAATCRELVYRAGIQPETPWADVDPASRERIIAEVLKLRQQCLEEQFYPTALTGDAAEQETPAELKAVSAISLEAWANAENLRLLRFNSVLELCDTIYATHQAYQELEELRSQLLSRIRRHISRTRRKLEARAQDLERSMAASDYRLRGELILAHLHQIPKGAKAVELPNFHDPDYKTVRVDLDPALSPVDNAERYFHKARRLDRTRKMAQVFLQQAEEELKYLEGVAVAVENAEDVETLVAIARELDSQENGRRQTQAGANRARKPKRAAKQQPGMNPLRFTSSSGWTILVGRHNRENDFITFQVAKPDDWWFHVKNEAGSHVIARAPGGATTGEIPAEVVQEAALLAAYYSRSRHGQNVAVDYTQRRHVTKPRGARPGNVVYVNFRTTFVTPKEEQIQELRK